MKLYEYYENCEEADVLVDLVDAFCQYRKENGPPRGFSSYHPSAFGHCLRNMQYLKYAENGVGGLVMPKEKMAGKILRLFDKGHNMHARWAKYFEDIGVLRGVWRCQNPLCRLINDDGSISQISIDEIYKNSKPRVYGKENVLGVFKPLQCMCGHTEFYYEEVLVHSDELNFHGHADMILDFSNVEYSKYSDLGFTMNLGGIPEKPIVVDMKTANDNNFVKTKSHGPDPAYIIQLTIYANILGCEYGVLIYENKNKSDALAFKIHKNTDTIYADVVKQATMMKEMAKHNLLPPPRPASKDCFECRKCLFKKVCHNSAIWDAANFEKIRKDFYGSLLFH
ncbi:MAG: hypothetical protein WDA06_00505 [Phenylobacterium sp.]